MTTSIQIVFMNVMTWIPMYVAITLCLYIDRMPLLLRAAFYHFPDFCDYPQNVKIITSITDTSHQRQH